MSKSKRKRVDEVLDKKSREGRGVWKYTADTKLSSLHELWRTGRHSETADFFPLRTVTLLEVFCRRSIETLIDHGPPFLDHAATVIPDMKFDYAVALAMQGRKISAGNLVAHEVSINGLSDISNHFSKLLGEDFFAKMAATKNPFHHCITSNPETIVDNVDELKRTLARLFSVRHILTHEAPEAPPYDTNEIDMFMRAAKSFMRATEAMIFIAMHPDHGERSPLEREQDDYDELRELSETLDRVISSFRVQEELGPDPDLFKKSQEAWSVYAREQASFRSSTCRGGSLEAWVYRSEMKRLVAQRTQDLQWWNERIEGEI